MTSSSDLDFMEIGFGKEPIAVFIGLPDSDKSNWFMATVFINQMYFVLSKLATAMPEGELPRRVHFLLDEFGNLPAVDNMNGIMTVCLGRQMIFTLVVQSLSQLDAVYGDEIATAITENCGNYIYIKTANDRTAERISNMLGSETIVTINRTGKKGSINKEMTEMVEEQPLLRPTELTTLGRGEMVVLRYMKNSDIKGKAIRITPIFNLGEHRMKFAHEFLKTTFPPGQQLYRSESLNKIIKETEWLNEADIKVVDVGLNITSEVELEKVSRSPAAYIKYVEFKQEPFPCPKNADGETLVEMKIIFNLINITEEEKDIYTTAYDEEDYIHMIKYGDIINHAKKCIQYNDKSIASCGYELLNIIMPLPIREKTEEEAWQEKLYEEYVLAKSREETA